MKADVATGSGVPAEGILPSGWSAEELAVGNPVDDGMLEAIREEGMSLPRQSAAYIFSHTGFRLIGRLEDSNPEGVFERLRQLQAAATVLQPDYTLHLLPYIDEAHGFTYGVFRDEEGDHFGRISFDPMQRGMWLSVNQSMFYESEEI